MSDQIRSNQPSSFQQLRGYNIPSTNQINHPSQHGCPQSTIVQTLPASYPATQSWQCRWRTGTHSCQPGIHHGEDSQPVPFLVVKSPPFSPMQRVQKFLVMCDFMSAKSSITIWPTRAPLMPCRRNFRVWCTVFFSLFRYWTTLFTKDKKVVLHSFCRQACLFNFQL